MFTLLGCIHKQEKTSTINGTPEKGKTILGTYQNWDGTFLEQWVFKNTACEFHTFAYTNDNRPYLVIKEVGTCNLIDNSMLIITSSIVDGNRESRVFDSVSTRTDSIEVRNINDNGFEVLYINSKDDPIVWSSFKKF